MPQYFAAVDQDDKQQQESAREQRLDQSPFHCCVLLGRWRGLGKPEGHTHIATHNKGSQVALGEAGVSESV